MTEDTKRAVEIIRPICKELGLIVSADDTVLQIGDVKVGIYANSTYATLMEALGILFVKKYPEFRHIYGFAMDEAKGVVSWYWVKPKTGEEE